MAFSACVIKNPIWRISVLTAAASAAINTDIRQIKVLLEQASNAITKAVSDGDMTDEDAGTLGGLLEQNAAKLTPENLQHAVKDLAAACGMFD